MTHESSTSADSVSTVGSRFDVSASAPHHETARAPRRSPAAQSDVHRSREYVRRRMAANQPIVPAEGNRSRTYRATKRCVDLVGAIVLLVLFAPLLLAVLVVLTFTTGGRPLFIQRRVGYLGRQFPLIKFRTMRHDAARLQARVTNEKDGPIFKNRTDPRITRIGRVLRKTSIDEMPQLVNVLLGQMALVGPRPPVASEVLEYESWQRRRLAIKPGLTCLWQVSGRSDIGFVDWVRMDLWYVQHQGLATDLELLIRTPWSVISCRGAY